LQTAQQKRGKKASSIQSINKKGGSGDGRAIRILNHHATIISGKIKLRMGIKIVNGEWGIIGALGKNLRIHLKYFLMITRAYLSFCSKENPSSMVLGSSQMLKS
jgi:hypothetical protein